jgi:hypothetical protein
VGGRLSLFKAVLEAITIYWIFMASIPKSIINKIRKTCFTFLWAGRIGKGTTVKGSRRLGLKNLYLFGKALASKSLWRLITKVSY